MASFINELKKLGLKDKEAAVYLACLELGASPVQQIARKARVVRATTYVILECLMKRGLATKFKEGKKTLFSAEPPRQLMRLLEKQQEAIRERQHELEDLLPQLQMVAKTAGGKPTVRYFGGVEGLQAIRREMLMYSRAGDTWYSLTPIDHLDAVLHKEQDSFYRQRNAKRIKSKTIYISKSPETRRQILSRYENKGITRRYISSSRSRPVGSGMTIFRDRIAIGQFTGEVGGVVIESKEMAHMMKALFDLAWLGAKTLDE